MTNMLKRKFYDLLLIALIVIAIAIFAIQAYPKLNNYQEKSQAQLQECTDQGLTGNEFAECVLAQDQQNLLTIMTYRLIMYILSGIYYIFILVLAIQLHKRNKLSMLNTIVIALIVPLAPIFYLATLREPLKEFESGQVSTPVTTPKQIQP